MKMRERREPLLFLIGMESWTVKLKGENPRLIDEWQEAPVLWDAVRTAVDDRQEEGLFILTGSTSVDDSQIHHSGTGRISRLKISTLAKKNSIYKDVAANVESLSMPTLDSYITALTRLFVMYCRNEERV